MWTGLQETTDKKLKLDRIKNLKGERNFKFYKSDIADFKKLLRIFKKFKPQIVINLAAQAGVRYSIKNPFEYSRSNLVGFGSILECCKILKIKHLVFASSSSVYGLNKNLILKTKIKRRKMVRKCLIKKKEERL